MKDLIITAKRQRRELIYLLTAFVLANAFNIVAIITYSSPAKELVTSIFYVLALTIMLYVAWTVVRLAVWIISKPFKNKKRK